MQISGLVQSVSPRSFTSRAGKPITVYDAVVDGQDVECGYDRPPFNAGDTVTIDVEVNRYGKTALIKPGKPSSGSRHRPSTGGAKAAPAPAPRKGFPVDTSDHATSIVRQNSLTNAVQTVVNSHLADGKGDEELAELIIKIAYKYADFSTGQREVKEIMGDG